MPNGLFTMLGFGPNEVYASGGYSNLSGVLEKYNGSSWTVIANSSTVPAGNMTVGGNNPDSLYLVGEGIFHLHDTTWMNETPSSDQYLVDGIALTNWNNVWVSGQYGYLTHFNGYKWFANYPFLNLSPSFAFVSILAFPNDVFILGNTDNSTYFIHGQ